MMAPILPHRLHIHRVSEKTPTHINGYKLRNSCLILTIFGTTIPHLIRHRNVSYAVDSISIS